MFLKMQTNKLRMFRIILLNLFISKRYFIVRDASKNEIIDDLASKNYAESTTISTSLYSNYDTPDVSISEKSQFEYQIQELQHQKRKIDEELTRVRLDLSSTSDLNESLQGNLDKLVKKLAK